MALETDFSDISKLNPAWPTGTDLIKAGDDHIRGVKHAIQGTFPNIKGAVTASHTEMNALTDNVGVANGAMTIKVPVDLQTNRITNIGAPTADTDAVTRKYVTDGFVPRDSAGNATPAGDLIVANTKGVKSKRSGTGADINLIHSDTTNRVFVGDSTGVTQIAGTSTQIVGNGSVSGTLTVGSAAAHKATTLHGSLDTEDKITAKKIYATLPAAGADVGGVPIGTSILVGTADAGGFNIAATKNRGDAHTIAKLTVHNTANTGGAEVFKEFTFSTDGNFGTTGTVNAGGVATNALTVTGQINAGDVIHSNKAINTAGNVTGGGLVSTGALSVATEGSFGGNIMTNAGHNIGLKPHNTTSNNGILMNNTPNDSNEGVYVNQVAGNWYAAGWSIGGVRGGSTDLDRVQINVNNPNDSRPDHRGGTFMFLNTGVGAADHGWTQGSDKRLKKDIVVVADAIEKMKTFNGVTFKYIKGDLPSAGYVAQDVQKVLPEVVSEGVNGMLSLNVAAVGALHHEAILALVKRVESLEAEVASLKAK